MTLKSLVGLRIRETRVAAGLSQEELAARINKSKQSIGQIERAENAPSFETLEDIARALKVAPAYLFPTTPLTHKKPTARDEALAALVTGAAMLPDEEVEIIRIFVDALLAREE